MGARTLDSVEYLEFNEGPSGGPGTARSVFQSSFKWKIQDSLALSFARSRHCVVSVGHCLIVGGGQGRQGTEMSVEVINTKGNTVWNLPTLSTQTFRFSMAATIEGIVLLHGSGKSSCESLPLVSMKRYLVVRLLFVYDVVASVKAVLVDAPILT